MVFIFVADVLSEDTILHWYQEGHLSKGKSVFLEQMKPFIEWLKNAEEGRLVYFVAAIDVITFS